MKSQSVGLGPGAFDAFHVMSVGRYKNPDECDRHDKDNSALLDELDARKIIRTDV